MIWQSTLVQRRKRGERAMSGSRKAKSPSWAAATRLHDWCVAKARDPALYLAMGAPDTVEGRFELLTLHAILVINRLRGTPGGEEIGQALFDVYLSNLDGALREMGVGDLAMGKRMRKLGEVFYGRALAYEAAFNALPDLDALESLIARTVLAEDLAAPTAPLADYVAGCHRGLADCDGDLLLVGEIATPARRIGASASP
jgi:cytochrome b pre-mRNA-processing protein 3